MNLHIGTSGFSYQDWVGHFYPEGTKKSDFLTHYSRYFDSLEVNYTYYRMPSQRTMQGLVDKSGGAVRFAVKLTGLFTHERSAGPEEARLFTSALEPMSDSGTLGCLLAQFPYAFKPTQENYNHLDTLAGWFQDSPLVVEVRNRNWLAPRFFDFLKARQIGFCCVDEPQIRGLLPDLKTVTSPIGYVRFHGRNADKWYNHERAEERYDYLYSHRELASWVPGIKSMRADCEELYLFFNNHFEGKAVANAMELREMLTGY